MDAKYFFYLYLRNAKTTFFSGFADPAIFQYATPFLWVAHISLLPFTLTIGAAAKSIFDVMSRTFIAEELISERKDAIQEMDKGSMERLVQDICAYEAKSDSSQMLIRELKQLNSSDKQDVVEGYESKRMELAWEQLDSPERKSLLAEFIELDAEYQEQLDSYTIVKQNEASESKLQQQRSLIVNYLDQEKNQGKKMLRVILGLFNEPASKHLAEKAEHPITHTLQG